VLPFYCVLVVNFRKSKKIFLTAAGSLVFKRKKSPITLPMLRRIQVRRMFKFFATLIVKNIMM